MNENYNTEKLMYRLFGADAEVPGSTKSTITHTCASLPEKGKLQRLMAERRQKSIFLPFAGDKSTNRQMPRRAVLTVAAAAAALLFAGSVFAYGAFRHGIFSSAWGGEEGTEIGTYLSATGELCEFPAFERAAFDEEKAEAVLGEYVVPCGKSYTCAGNTVTVLEYMCDDLGMGYVSLLIENPNGVSGLTRSEHGIVYFDGTGGFTEPMVLSGCGGEADQRLVSNSGMSSDTRAYVSIAFAGLKDTADSDGLSIVYREDDGSGGTLEKTLELPAFRKIPSAGFTDAERQYAVEVSPLGISVGKVHEQDGGDVGEIKINYADDAYVVQDNGVLNAVFGLINDRTCRTDTVFNRLAVPEEITSVTLDGVVLTPAETLPETGWKIEAAESEFSFRAGDAQVFVLAANAISAATDEEWQQFCQAEGAELTRREMLDCYPESPSTNDITAAEAIRLAYEKADGTFDLSGDTVRAEFFRYGEDNGVWKLYFEHCADVTIGTPDTSSFDIYYMPKYVWDILAEPSSVETVFDEYNDFVFAEGDTERAGELAQKLFAEMSCAVSPDEFAYYVCDRDHDPCNGYHYHYNYRAPDAASDEEDMVFEANFPYIRVSAPAADGRTITASFFPDRDGRLVPVDLNVE